MLLSEADLRDLRFLTTTDAIRANHSCLKTDKICGISGTVSAVGGTLRKADILKGAETPQSPLKDPPKVKGATELIRCAFIKYFQDHQ